MSRQAYITQSALSKAYSQQSLDWMLKHWERNGLAGCYPTLELYDHAVNMVFKYGAELESLDPYDFRESAARKNLSEWRNIAKFLDTIITHPEYRSTHREFVMPISDLKIKDVYHQLKEIA